LRQEIAALDVADNVRYKIGQLALLKDYASLAKALTAAAASGIPQTSKKEMKEEPLLKRAMRENRHVRQVLSSGNPVPVTTIRSAKAKRGRR
jgi:hypothetical protein